ncbi:ZmpA/ZmpB/ZmpC family metallo-endopeptidase-related protein [Priestia flexa]|uniref:ZmpA/ZmpB/ZmpC family metallo-endopeptidase-related protein n=1 Tax=Priestia flexa TaxID=86664 RepID=UPI00240E097D|nr:ZmpA/ZmpB/ZmpC family metallo-endopeptidase-related protein [Priestia flexa]WEZ10154.1 ZmpA/ZmpB/ZmpC family metallo-endopeptidase-related protein [Priestia flexa]
MLGLGTVESPYIIESIQDLQNVQNNLTANYELAHDIDATGFNFVPIGGTSLVIEQSFRGIFDGKGYKIINLKINQTGNYAGLFSYLNGATIKNLGLENVDITGGQYSAALSSYCWNNCTIQQCYATGKVHSLQYFAGGLIGGNSGSTVENCWTNVAVLADTTNATYMAYTGGFASRDSGSSKFRYCYSLGTVKNGTGASAKGFIGNPNTTTGTSRTTITACFYDKTTSKCITDGVSGLGATGYTTTQMQTASIYYAYDKVNIWYVADGSYPTLQVFDHTVIQNVSVKVSSDIGNLFTKSNTYRVSKRQPKTSLNIYASNYVVRNVKRFGNGFISKLYSTSTQGNRSVRSIYVNISSEISPILSTNRRKAKVKRVNVSSVNKIEGILNFISNQRPKQIVAFVHIETNMSNINSEVNNVHYLLQKNTSSHNLVQRPSRCYLIQNMSFMEVIKMPFNGDTIRLKVNFRDFDNQSVNPSDVKLTIYDTDKQTIESIELNDTNKIDEGVYFYDYVLPDDKREVTFEFRGIHNEKPILTRGTIPIKF